MTKPVHVEDYYSGSGYWDTAFSSALAASDWVIVGAGRFYVSSAITLNAMNRIEGAGSNVTEIVSVTANAPVMSIPIGATNIRLTGFTVGHIDPARITAGMPIDSYTGRVALGPYGYANSGGSGIKTDTRCDLVSMTDVSADYNYIGFDLNQCGYCPLTDCSAGYNESHGFRFLSTGILPLQWYPMRCSASQNGGDGFHWENGGTNANGTSVGQMTGCITYSNDGNGVAFLGTAANPMHSARIENGFIGEDQGHGVYLDTYGTKHFVSPSFVELAAATGIYVSANNRDTVIRTQIVYNCGLDGIFNWGEATQISGGIINCNGRLATSGRRNGIYLYESGGTKASQVTGARSTDIAGNPNPALAPLYGFLSGQQQIGILCSVGAQLVGNDVRGNSVVGISGTPNAASGLNRT